tara:strand:+ start:456 stop:938 length:483 start_codon:yes stop_codon:yes gene_type:complete
MIEVHLIWAQDDNGGIGINGKLPWHISNDLKNFKKITLNSTIIMGRKTWDSLPIKPLPKRTNIVFSSNKQKNVTTYNSYEECIKNLQKDNIKKIFIIGGRSIYKLFFNDAHYLHITNVNLIKNEINEFFPISFNDIKSKFNKISTNKLSDEASYSLWEKK